MEAGGALPAGSGRALRLDPFALPVRFPAQDAGADGQVRQVELDHDRVVLRRAVRGIRMNVGVPVSTFRGVALRLSEPADEKPASVAVILDHRDSGLSVPLLVAFDIDDVVAVWRAWGRVLRLPLLLVQSDGQTHEAFPQLGQIGVGEPAPRRRRSSAIKRRRPSILLRRRPGIQSDGSTVYCGEREIIARN